MPKMLDRKQHPERHHKTIGDFWETFDRLGVKLNQCYKCYKLKTLTFKIITILEKLLLIKWL